MSANVDDGTLAGLEALPGGVALTSSTGEQIWSNPAWRTLVPHPSPVLLAAPCRGRCDLVIAGRQVTVDVVPFDSGWLVQHVATVPADHAALTAYADALARGAFGVPKPSASGDAALVNALSRIEDVFQRALAMLSETEVPRVDHGFLTPLGAALDDLRAQTQGIMASSEQLQSGSSRVREASQSLANNAARSAASLQQISASMHEISAQTRDNAGGAARALTIANKALEAANLGDGQVNQVRAAMENMDESSRNISNIIRVIDDIAFQTNLLALNAAVEAGRAGVHGRGFAVVADEVRRLAGRSAQAASETAELIQTSLRNLKEGHSVVGVASDSLSTIVGEVTQVTELLQGIASSTREQAVAASQVNESLAMVDSLTQHNAAKAAEMAKTAFELAQQSQGLTGHLAVNVADLAPAPQNGPQSQVPATGFGSFTCT